MSSTLTIIPKAAVTTYLRVLRLPLDAVESVVHRKGAAEWPPALAFDAFEAQVKGILGTILRDEALVQEASLERTRIEQLRRAVTLEAEADTRKREADRELADRRRKAEDRAEAADERTERAEARLEKEKAEAKQRVRKETAQKQQRARKAAGARQERVDDLERDAEAERLAAKRKALSERKEAVEATGDALKLDKAAASVKERRQARK